MAVPEEAIDTGAMTSEEAVQAMMLGEAPEDVEIVTEIPKSPHMLRTKKGK